MVEPYKILHALVTKYNKSDKVIDEIWHKIEAAYSETQRHYHNMQHINDLLFLIATYAQKLNLDHEVLYFAALYHDIIYQPQSSTNEEDSARVAKQDLTRLKVPTLITNKVFNLILATKNHLAINDLATQFFLDADLSILGAEHENYITYRENIRKEYHHVPDLEYKVGRISILEHFIKRTQIFHTPLFRTNFEKKARKNIQEEISFLSSQ